MDFLPYLVYVALLFLYFFPSLLFSRLTQVDISPKRTLFN